MIELFQSILTIDLLGAVGIGLLGGLMHGYTGWGGAMVMMPLMSVLYGPVYALAIILMGGIMVSVQLFPWAIRRVDWREMTPMFIAIAVSIPGGTYLLFLLDPTLVIRIIGFLIIGAALVQLIGWSYAGPRGVVPATVAGVMCGTINGFAGLGGPPLVLYVLSKPDPPDQQKANILIAVAIVCVGAFVAVAVGGGVTGPVAARGVIVAPAQMAGAWLGASLFSILPGDFFKKFSLVMLIILGFMVAIF